MKVPIRELIKTDEGCLQVLRDAKYPNGKFKCAGCGHDKKYDLRSRALTECARCGHQISLTAGTIFHGLRTPIRKVFAILTDLADGIHKSAFTIAAELQLPITTVWRLLHRLRNVLAKLADCSSDEAIHHSLITGVLYRRSIESKPGVASHLVTGVGSSRSLSSNVEVTRKFIADVFRGVSRKYAQLYIHQFRFSLASGNRFEKLLSACLECEPLSDVQIQIYSSSTLLLIPVVSS